MVKVSVGRTWEVSWAMVVVHWASVGGRVCLVIDWPSWGFAAVPLVRKGESSHDSQGR